MASSMRELAVKPPIKHVDVARLTYLNGRTSRLRSSRYQHVWLKCAELDSGGMSGRSQEDHVGLENHRRSSPTLHTACGGPGAGPDGTAVGHFHRPVAGPGGRLLCLDAAVLDPQQGTDDLAIHDAEKAGGANARTVPLGPARRGSATASETSSGRTSFSNTCIRCAIGRLHNRRGTGRPVVDWRRG